MKNVNWPKQEKNTLNSLIKALIVLMVYSYSIELTKAQDYIPLTYNLFDSVPGLNNEYGIKSIPWSDGILFLGNGRVNEKNQNYSFSLTQYDLNGNKIWEKAYQHPAFNSISAHDIGSFDGNYLYVVGDFLDELNSDRFLCKLNLNGDTVFFRKYLAEGHQSIIDMEILSPDTLILLSVRKEQYDSEDIITVIDMVDSNGNIIKSTEDSSDYKSPKDLIRHNDIIYVGGNLVTHPDSINSKVFISRYDFNLEYLGISTPSLTERENFFYFTKTNENLLFTSRITLETQTPYLYRTNISSVNQQGMLIDTNTFGPTDFAYYYATTTIVGDEFIATYISEDTPNIYFHDLQLNPLCNYLIDIPHNTPTFAVLAEITSHSYNMMSGTGYIGYSTGSGVNIKQWNFLTDDIPAFLYENCDLVSLPENLQKQNKYRVSQSISNKTITIENLSEENSRITEIRAVNLDGRLVLSREFKERTTINTQKFSKGLYVMQLINGEHAEAHKLLVY